MIAAQLPSEYSTYLAVAQLYVARSLSSQENDAMRRRKMFRAQDERIEMIAANFGLGEELLRSQSKAVELLKSAHMAKIAQRTLLVDVAYSNPFAPYYLKYREDDRNKHLTSLARDAFGLDGTTVDNMVDIAGSARTAHRKWFQNPLLWMAVTVGGGVLMGGIGFLAAPAIGGILGGATGLYGAAATAHGLALLGGGSLAVGGAGMAGGMALVTMAGVGIGSATGGGAALLMALTPEAAVAEIVKLQTTFAFAALPESRPEARTILKNLRLTISDLEEKLTQALERHDHDAPVIHSIQQNLEAARRAEAWMKKRLESK